MYLISHEYSCDPSISLLKVMVSDSLFTNISASAGNF